MTIKQRVISGARFGLATGLFTLIPVGRLQGKALAVTSVGVGVGVGGLVGVAAFRRPDQRGEIQPDEEEGSTSARLAMAGITGIVAGAGVWLTCTTDRLEEAWLRRRGLKKPRPWMALAAAVVGGVTEAIDQPRDQDSDQAG
ncbi:hypothetical protein [Galactobacter sp.]|uniref:hypothetical protein n=1 Tax=Galactobacter sp. TaxID=2676125 RepID=UPI0025C34A06|nr:hypothetical protein [Galactobacter sp.]